MAIGPDRTYLTRAQTGAADIDVGLRQYMLRVYNYMAGGVALTGIVAYAFHLVLLSNPGLIQVIYGTPLKYVVIFAPFLFSLFFSARMHAMSAATAQALFWVFASVMGLSLASIFLVFTMESIAQTFFIAAGMFAGMSLYGYTTKRDLSGWGSFLAMGFWGIFLALIVNMFLQSSAVGFAVSVIGVFVFAGLTAYYNQQIKEMYLESDVGEVMAKKAIIGAYVLYVNFINLFVMLLRIFGAVRSN
ncbi:MAG TPA: Bax inhibitor-1/YccA family protein [Dongiaceae bacterium]|jgi:FtsH-binding integral membrane protein